MTMEEWHRAKPGTPTKFFTELPRRIVFSETARFQIQFSETGRFRHTRFLEVQAPSQPFSFARGGWTLSLHGLSLLGDY